MLPEKTSCRPIQPFVLQYLSRPGMAGMSQVDPASALASTGSSLLNSFVSFLHIGAGRQEADKIVPYQNRVVNDVIAPIVTQLTGNQNLPYSSWASMLDTLNKTETGWLQFLHNTQWTDGRAAQQAEADLQPYFDDQRRKLQEKMAAAGGPSFGDFFSGIFGNTNNSAIQPVSFPGQSAANPYGTPPILPAGSQYAQTQRAGFDTTSMLLIGAVVLGLFMIPTRKG